MTVSRGSLRCARDLSPFAPSVIRGVLWVDSSGGVLVPAHRAWSPQIAQAPGVLRASARPGLSADGYGCNRSASGPAAAWCRPGCQRPPRSAVHRGGSREALDKGILLGLVRRDVVPGHAGLVLPREHGSTGQLAAVVADDAQRLAVEQDDGIEAPDDPLARDRRVGGQRQTLPRVIVDHRQEVERPALPGTVGNRHRLPRAGGALAAALAANAQPFLAVQPIELLVV